MTLPLLAGTAIFLTLFTIERFTTLFLRILNINSILKNRKAVPSPFKGVIDEDEYSQAVSYSLEKERFGFAGSLGATLLTATLFLFKIPAKIETFIGAFQLPPIAHGVVFITVIGATLTVIGVPAKLYSLFYIEEKYGFNKMTGKLFLKDSIKSTLLSLFLGIPLLILLFWLVETLGERFWFYGFLAVTGYQLLIMFIYPTFIAPIFNKFSPLEEGALKEKLTALAKKCQFKAKGLYVMDGSRRSGHGNAYFTGFGSARRIVLYDTLIESMNEDEVEAVLAHEIGHYKKKHILKMTLLSLLFSFVGFYLLGRALTWDYLFTLFGFSTSSIHGLIIIFALFSAPFLFLFTPLESIWHRKHEYEADRYVAEATGTSAHLKSALINLSRKNLTNLTPHPAYALFYYSHPPFAERIAALTEK